MKREQISNLYPEQIRRKFFSPINILRRHFSNREYPKSFREIFRRMHKKSAAMSLFTNVL